MAIPKYYGDICRQGAWDYILGPVEDGGYGLSREELSDQEQYELTWALLDCDNFTYAAGVSILHRTACLCHLPSFYFKAARGENDVKYSHPVIWQYTHRTHYKPVHRHSHPLGKSGETVSAYYKLPGLLNPFSSMGAATSLSNVSSNFYCPRATRAYPVIKTR